MHCPVCNQPLVILELNQVEIDYCLNCYGIWLDEGELEILLPDSEEKVSFFNSFEINKVSREKTINCPICLKTMVKVNYGKKSKVILDKCKQQHGIWFGKGELYTIIKIGGLDKEGKIVSLLGKMFSNLNK